MNGTEHESEISESLRALARFAWVFGAALAIAMSFPQPLFAAAMSSVLGFGAGLMATVAIFARDHVWSEELSRWDVAAALYAWSLVAGFFVDIDRVEAFLAAQKMMN